MKSVKSFRELLRITWASDVVIDSIVYEGHRWRAIVKEREVKRRCFRGVPTFRIKDPESFKFFR
jgi:hypothetical protein